MVDLLFKLAGPALALLDPERAHGLAIRALKSGLVGAVPRPADDPILATTVWNLAFPNPVGLAAGFDKDAEVCDAALALGFGFRGGRHGDAAAAARQFRPAALSPGGR